MAKAGKEITRKPNRDRPGALLIYAGNVPVADMRLFEVGRGKQVRVNASIHCLAPGCTYAVNSGEIIAYCLYISHYSETHDPTPVKPKEKRK